jgi:hypothetical protein
MGEFHHHPDGWIMVVPTSGSQYVDTPANFQTDYGQPAPALPAGADEQLYTQNVRHAYKRRGSVVSGGPVPYTWGDNCIAAVSSLLSAQSARVNAGFPNSGAPHPP